MADVSVTVANVAFSGTASLVDYIAGAAITQGQTVYIDATSKVQPASATGSVLTGAVFGIAMNAALTGQPVKVNVKDKQLVPGFTASVGDVVFQSVNAGKMTVTIADVQVTGSYVTVLGVMNTTTQMNFSPVSSTGTHT